VQVSWTLTRLAQPSCTIKQVEIDIKSGRSLSEIKEVWLGHAKLDSEGPHIYKKDGFYYLLIAEGGTFKHQMLSMARSSNIWVPYESSENNPVLTADDKDEYFQKHRA
jgi:beta-xylosidase